MYIVNYIQELLMKSKELATSDPKTSFSHAEKALQISKNNKLEIQQGHSLFHMAYACRVMSEYSKGMRFAFDALDILSRHNDHAGILKCKNIIGIIYFYFGSYGQALENFNEALEIVHDHPDSNMESSILNNIGEIYKEAKESTNALKYYHMALAISTKNKLLVNSGAIYLNIGDIYCMQGEYQKSHAYFSKAFDIAADHKDSLYEAEAEIKLGKAMFYLEDYQKAQSHYISALFKLNKISNKYYMIELLINMSALNEAIGISPLRQLNEALEYALEIGLDSKVSEIYKLLSAYYENTQAYKTALNYFKAYHRKEKEIEATNLSKKLEIMSVEFNYYKERNEIDRFRSLAKKLEYDVSQTRQEVKNLKEENISLMKDSIIDELTQLYNRRGMEKLLLEKLSHKPELFAAVIIIDIDHFKKYNDYWGHIQGDACLCLISNVLKNLPYENYFSSRYGGEEFLCLVELQSDSSGYESAEYIRKSIEALAMNYRKEPEAGIVTVSIGVKEGLLNRDNFKELINLADNQLYISKESGRNRVSVDKD